MNQNHTMRRLFLTALLGFGLATFTTACDSVLGPKIPPSEDTGGEEDSNDPPGQGMRSTLLQDGTVLLV